MKAAGKGRGKAAVKPTAREKPPAKAKPVTNNGKRPKARQLQQWAIEALDLGFGCISDGDHAPFILFLADSGQRHLVDLQSESGMIDSNLVASGREIIQRLGPGHLYGLVWDGYLTTDSVKRDAVFVEAGAEGDPQAYVFAQAYSQKKRSKALEKVGDPLIANKVPSLWS